MEVTITHKGLGETITFPIFEEAGTPLFSVDVGKPELQIREGGVLEPRFRDSKSQLENYTIVSQLQGPNAYSDAIQLADMIKSRTGNGEELTVQLSGEEIPDAYPTTETNVAPAAEQQRALELTYAPGRTNVVDVELQLTRVRLVRGSSNQIADTPTTSFGDGTIRLENNTASVGLFEGITVTRTVGRPNDVIRSGPMDYPNFTTHKKAAHDAFDIEFQLVENAQSKVSQIKNEIFQPTLGTDALTLDFNGAFGMDTFSVMPTGSQSLRVQRIAAQKSIENLPTVSLRRVQ